MATRDDVVVVGEAANSNDSIAVVLEHAPDIVLLDLDLPPAGGIAATAQLIGIAPMVRVVLFSVRDDEELGLAGLQAGAAGFLSKDIDMSALARALRSVAGGEAAVSRRMALQAIIRLRSMASARPPGGGPQRERDRKAASGLDRHGARSCPYAHARSWRPHDRRSGANGGAAAVGKRGLRR